MSATQSAITFESFNRACREAGFDATVKLIVEASSYNPALYSVELRTKKVLNTTHFKAMARIGGPTGYRAGVFSFNIVFSPQRVRTTHRPVDPAAALEVIRKAGASKETTRDALAERKAKIAATRPVRLSPEQLERQIEDYVFDIIGYDTDETRAIARKAVLGCVR